MLRAAIAAIVVVLTTVPAHAQTPYAQVLRCVDADGNVEYRSSPCPAGAREGVVTARTTSSAETSTGGTTIGETSAAETSAVAPIRRRAYISPERKQALDVAERYAAVARAARPQVQVQVIPPTVAGK